MRTWRPAFPLAVVGLAAYLLITHAATSSPEAASRDESGRGQPKTLGERVETLERAASSGGSAAPGGTSCSTSAAV
jgi:hypothetical protein